MATELGKAYVQIMPSARGIKGSIQGILDPEAESAGKSAGEKTGSSIVSTIKKVVVAAGIGKFLKESLFEGGALQQSIGGIETLFKDSADIVKAYAQDAYKTAGVSANQYMEQTTSFAASLLQSVSGDTEKAAEYAHMAMVDMSDNANKMGTDMVSIQNAYQGFAKQNYTMLDNLKLGYGGTKKEMERLLADAQKISGVEYNIENLADVYEAIHIIQQELDITGTTALEAEETLTGSFAAMKGALKNVLGALSLGEGLAPTLAGLADTVSVFLFNNLIPMVINILKSLPGAIVQFIQLSAPRFLEAGAGLLSSIADGIGTGVPILLDTIYGLMVQLIGWIRNEFPAIMQNGVEAILSFATGIMSSLPLLADTVGLIVEAMLAALLDAMPTILHGGFVLITGLAQGLMDNLPEITRVVAYVLENLVDIIVERIPEFVTQGSEIISGMAQGLMDSLPTIIESAVEIVMSIADTILNNLDSIMSATLKLLQTIISTIIENLPRIVEMGVSLLLRFADGIISRFPQIVFTITSLIGQILSTIAYNLPQILAMGIKIIGELVIGIAKSIPRVLSTLATLAATGLETLARGFAGIFNIGANLIKGLWQGISSVKSWIMSKISGYVNSIVSGIKRFFGIASPSKVFAKIGEQLDEGLAQGIVDNTKPITKAMDDVARLTTRSFESEVAITASASNLKGITASIDAGYSQKENAQPAYLTFNFGGHQFKAFVEDITKLQDREIEVQLAY